MSCRHDLALGTCRTCYPSTGSIDPGLESDYGTKFEDLDTSAFVQCVATGATTWPRLPASAPMVVFDVESMGLHGVGFAVGAVVVDEAGRVLEEFAARCEMKPEEYDIVEWVRVHVYPALTTMPESLSCPRDVRQAFWAFWRRWAEKGAALWADCGWPVEAHFLIDCVEDGYDVRWMGRGLPSNERWFLGPYPLHEIADYIGMETHGRLPSELPAHNPLNDARQSARLLVKALHKRRGLGDLIDHGPAVLEVLAYSERLAELALSVEQGTDGDLEVGEAMQAQGELVRKRFSELRAAVQRAREGAKP